MKPTYLKKGLSALCLFMLMAGCSSKKSESKQGGIALSFDDRFIKEWHSLLPLFRQYNAKVTFYLSGNEEYSQHERVMLRQFLKEGHEIGFHGSIHGNVNLLIQHYGPEQYRQIELEPGISQLKKLGITPTSYADPGGSSHPVADSVLTSMGFRTLRGLSKTERSRSGFTLYHIPPRFIPSVYTKPGNKSRVSALYMDHDAHITSGEIQSALLHARASNSILLLFGHKPLHGTAQKGEYGFDTRFLEQILRTAKQLDIPFYTMSELN